MRFDNKNIVIIGASSGIGFALAENLVSLGANVFGASRNPNANPQGVENIFLDILQNNTDWITNLPDVVDGLVYQPGSINLKPFHRLTEQDFITDYQVNLLGAVKVLQAVLPKLKKSSTASVVLYSSVAAQVGMGFHASIASSKGAVEGLARSLAAEWAPKIRVNVVAPSLTNTPLANQLLSTADKIEASNKRHPLGRIGTASDLSSIAQFLLSQESAWVTGQVFNVDGGISKLK